MAKQTVGDNIKIEDKVLIPVKPAMDNYRIPFVTDPSSFMMYGENALQQYNAEVKRVEAELRKEIYVPKEEIEAEPEKKVNLCSIAALVISIFVLAMLIIGKFLTIKAVPGLFAISDEVAALTYVLGFFENLNANWALNAVVTVAGILLTALFALISMLIGIFTIKKPGTGMFMKICLFLSFTGAVLTAIMLLIEGKENAIGLYIVIGLTFVSTLIGFCSKSAVKRAKHK